MSKQSLAERISVWMRGRNGQDELGETVFALTIILMVASLFVDVLPLSLLGLACALYGCWRMCSRNLAARAAENRAFVDAAGPLAKLASHPREAVSELRGYKRLRCPSCNQRMRVPRGKGKIRVSCPTCHHKFGTKS